MVISSRPFRAVAAALGVALLFVCLDRLSQAAEPALTGARVANVTTAACATPAAWGIVRAGS